MAIGICSVCKTSHEVIPCPKCGYSTQCENITLYTDSRIRRHCHTCGHVEFKEPLAGISFGSSIGIPDSLARNILLCIQGGINDWTDLARQGLGGNLQFSETDLISFLNCVRRPMYQGLCNKDLNEVIFISAITQTLYEQCQALLSKVQASIKVERTRWDAEKRKRDREARTNKLVEEATVKQVKREANGKGPKKNPQERFLTQCYKVGMSKTDAQKQWELLQNLGKVP